MTCERFTVNLQGHHVGPNSDGTLAAEPVTITEVYETPTNLYAATIVYAHGYDTARNVPFGEISVSPPPNF